MLISAKEIRVGDTIGHPNTQNDFQYWKVLSVIPIGCTDNIRIQLKGIGWIFADREREFELKT